MKLIFGSDEPENLKAWVEGYNAKSFRDNPYPKGSLDSGQWIQGYIAHLPEMSGEQLSETIKKERGI